MSHFRFEQEVIRKIINLCPVEPLRSHVLQMTARLRSLPYDKLYHRQKCELFGTREPMTSGKRPTLPENTDFR